MASYSYPIAHPEGQIVDPARIHELLSNPRVLAKRVADLTKMGFIADFLLTGRFDAQGGGIFYETGEEIFAADAPEAVAPNAEYPTTIMTAGELAAAKTVKWGLETLFTDEKISREGISHVNKGLLRLANSIIRHVDSVGMAVVASKVTSTFASPAAWTTPGAMIEALSSIRNTRALLGTGIDLETVVLKPAKFAKVVRFLVDSQALPRETGNIVLTGQVPVNAFGFTWATSPYATSDNPLLLDREQLGGIARENLNSPDYAESGGIEVRTERTATDSRTVRGRRVIVPVVTEPLAGVTITGTGL